MGAKDPKKGKPKASRLDREALREALSGVKPLRSKSPRRVQPAPTASSAARKPALATDEPLSVERESNGIVLGKRAGVHRSILEAMEDPALEVAAECDLHGKTAREAEREVARFLGERQRAGERWALIIVGKGLHSPGGKGALKDHVVRALSKGAASRFVLAFHTAPRRLGGLGALVVRLR